MAVLRFLRAALCVWLALWMVEAGPLAQGARAALLSTEQVLSARAEGEAARARVQAFLARADVERELARFGVDPERARARVALLSDEEVSSIAGKIDALPAGGDTLVSVLLIFAVVFILLIIFDAVGITDIFPWVNKPSQR
jgi:hypothetical protein